jgi:primosomal protein N'
MTHTVLQQIPLGTAYLCQDCNVVSSSAISCPACASRVLMGLAGVLDRDESEAKASLPQFFFLAA